MIANGHNILDQLTVIEGQQLDLDLKLVNLVNPHMK